MTAPDLPAPTEGFVLTHFVASEDVPRSAAFYRDVLDQKLKIVLDEQDAHLTSIAGRRFSQRKISR